VELPRPGTPVGRFDGLVTNACESSQLDNPDDLGLCAPARWCYHDGPLVADHLGDAALSGRC
jgi:hypothetical protein